MANVGSVSFWANPSVGGHAGRGLPGAPLERGSSANRVVGIVEQSVVCFNDVAMPVVDRQAGAQTLPLLREENRHTSTK